MWWPYSVIGLLEETLCPVNLRVLHIFKDNNCSMSNAFRLAGCPCKTMGDFVTIAKLRIIYEHELKPTSREICMGALKELEAVCSRKLWQHLPAMTNMLWEGQPLPLKFHDRFYSLSWLSFNTNNNKVITMWTNLLETMQNSKQKVQNGEQTGNRSECWKRNCLEIVLN